MSGAGSTAVNFTYDALGEPDAAWLRGAAAELRAKLRRTVGEVITSGRLLAQARKRLDRARWKPWLAKEAGIPARSAQRLVAVGTAFGGLPESVALNFTPSALYTLAEPGVPQSIRAFAVDQARDGAEVTAGRVPEWLGAFRENAEPTTKAGKAEMLKLAPDDDAEPDDGFTDPAEVFAKENWFLLCDLVGADGTVHLSATSDAESDDTPVFAGVHIDGAGKVRRATGGTAEAVVLKLSGEVRKKLCACCGERKPLDDFCRRTDMPDGREYRCKRCKRERVKDYTRRKAAAALKVAGQGQRILKS